ncbi:hypothetical protein VTJ83DRAFT_6816 [Remersonia thermophila]|uniref:Uncharacterized protein n=1 Tax=Remersonia thermophila TaxID=72144 RepID=A0ABR4D7A8_9PEZI
MARTPLIVFLISRLFLLFLICSSCAWVGSGAAAGPAPGSGREAGLVFRRGSRIGDTGSGDEQLWRRRRRDGRIPAGAGRMTTEREIEIQDDDDAPMLAAAAAAEPARVLPAGSPQPTITPPPSLLRLQARQDGQIAALSAQLAQLSEQSRQVSQASQQLSQSSQQLSQSLQQASQRLSQTEQSLASARLQASAASVASREMSQASAEASRRADEASRSADRAITEAMRSASQSASRAVSESLASLSASMSSVLSAASQSAADAMRSAASVARAAQAEATALRNEATSQIQQAQGQALSVTQTALAVVGGIIGSSLLTGAAFIFILRYRRGKRQQLGLEGRRAGNGGAAIGYPRPMTMSNQAYSVSRSLSSASSSSASSSILKKGYFAPPGPAGATGRDDASSVYSTDTSNNNNNNGFRFGAGAVGVKPPAPAATVGSGPVGYKVGINNNKGGGFKLGDPPPPRGAAVKAKTAAGGGAEAAAEGEAGTAAAGGGGGKFSLFPSSEKDPRQPGSAGPAQAKTRVGSVLSSAGIPSLEKWLRDGTTVSPFATAVKNGKRTSTGSDTSLGIGKAR